MRCLVCGVWRVACGVWRVVRAECGVVCGVVCEACGVWRVARVVQIGFVVLGHSLETT